MIARKSVVSYPLISANIKAGFLVRSKDFRWFKTPMRVLRCTKLLSCSKNLQHFLEVNRFCSD